MALVLLVLALPAAGGRASEPQTLDVMSFNIRWPMVEDIDQRSWERRGPLVVRLIREHQPDVVGLQEAHPGYLKDLLKALTGYAVLHGGQQRTANAILYLRQRLRLDEGGQFNLVSPAPGDRHCTWGRLTDIAADASFYVYNVHFDNRTPESRAASACVLARHIAGRSPVDPVIVTGDFNADESQVPIRYLLGKDPLEDEPGCATMAPVPLVDTFRARHNLREGIGTGHGFGGARNGRRIDFILVSADVRVLDAAIVRDHEDGAYPSDHFPVTARISLQAEACDAPGK